MPCAASPAPTRTTAARAAPQLAPYRRMVEAATNRPVRDCFIHMPVVGPLLDLTRETRQGTDDAP